MSDPSDLSSLVYVSEVRRPMSAAELVRLMEEIEPRNRSNGLTGMLLYKDGCFIQALEGPHQAVRATLERIRRDRRHRGLVVLQEQALAERQFPAWSMGFRNLNGAADDASDGPRPAAYSDFMQGGEPGAREVPGLVPAGAAGLLLRAFRQVSSSFALPQSRGR